MRVPMANRSSISFAVVIGLMLCYLPTQQAEASTRKNFSRYSTARALAAQEEDDQLLRKKRKLVKPAVAVQAKPATTKPAAPFLTKASQKKKPKADPGSKSVKGDAPKAKPKASDHRKVASANTVKIRKPKPAVSKAEDRKKAQLA